MRLSIERIVVLSTHIVSDVEAVATQISHGRLVRAATSRGGHGRDRTTKLS